MKQVWESINTNYCERGGGVRMEDGVPGALIMLVSVSLDTYEKTQQ